MKFLRVFSSYRADILAICTCMLALLFAAGSALSVAAPLPAPPMLSANSYLLIDYDSGEVLASKDPDKRIEPASLTKLMTAFIVSEELKRGSVKLDDPVLISAKAQAMTGSRMFIEQNTVVSLSDLLRGLIIQSGNDASVALAEHIAASEAGFVDMMNRTAKNLGMNNSNFMNASGLPDPNHYTTARDLAVIASAIIRQHPETYALYSEREFTYNDIKQRNRNTLLWRDESVDGMKTGHTEAAGYCLVASALRKDMRLISIVLGTASDKTRIAESQRLLNYGYRFFRTMQVYAAGEQISQTRIWMGTQDTVGLGVAEDFYVTLPRDAFDSLETRIEVSQDISAPLDIGQEVGRSVLLAENKIIGVVPLLALQKVEEGGIFTRMKHSVQRFF